jgi:SAM-dependent methyltransferase
VTDELAKQAEAVVRAHPGVLAATARSDGGQVEVRVTPRPGYPSPAKVAQWSEKRVSGWQLLWERGYATVPAPADPTFNIISWVSSYDCKPYSDEAMREWIDQGVARIRALAPRRVLELGCGAGLVAFRLAPFCEQYTGLDFSPSAVAQLRARAPANVTVLERAAHELDGLAGFDTVVINSVAQFFPDLAYLDGLIAQVVERLPAGGALFIGDVRSFAHLRAFHAAVRLAWDDGAVTRDVLAAEVAAEIQREAELHVDARWFRALPDRFPSLAGVEIQLKRGVAATEMSQFRYDVVLRVGPRLPAVEPRTLDWPAPLQPAELPMRVRNVPNRRLADAAFVLRWLDGRESRARTVAELRRLMAARDPSSAIDPETVWAHAGGDRVLIDWAASGLIDRMDITYRAPGAIVAPPTFAPPGGRVATDPLRPTWLRAVRPELEASLQAALGTGAARVRLVVDDSA